MRLLNIGCGNNYHHEWVNLDISSQSPEVIVHDLRYKLPFKDSSFDACYSSHVLEHLSQDEAKQMIEECFRVLKPNGIIRVVIPDLEAIVKKYIQLLEEIKSGKLEKQDDYDWMMLEMYDQTVRSYNGGEMGRYLSKRNITNKDFIISRIGLEAEDYWRSKKSNSFESITKKIMSKKLFWFIEQFRIKFARIIVLVVAGRKSWSAFEEGIFRNSGEIHRWMYDNFSLGRLLKKCNFVNIKVCDAERSNIPDFNSYQLDFINGRVRKPDSLFMEGMKP